MAWQAPPDTVAGIDDLKRKVILSNYVAMGLNSRALLCTAQIFARQRAERLHLALQVCILAELRNFSRE